VKGKTVLTCAVTGNAPVHPNYPHEYPVAPQQICQAVVEAAHAGASIAHIHVRDPATGLGSRDVNLFKETVSRIRDTGVDIVINLTAGLGALFLPDPSDESRGLPESDVIGVEERIAHLKECLPEIASLDVTTGNQVEDGFEYVYLNTTRTLRGMARRFRDLGVKPEMEVFQAGDVLFAKQLVEEGLIEGPPLFQFVLGVKWAAPADPETVLYMRHLLPSGALWGALGVGRMQMRIAAQCVLLGGNVRVGLEDNLYLERGVFATNGQLVERAVKVIEHLGNRVATPAEARQILALPGATG
jgi:uncharacterized protein (DUF849 family)